MTDPEVAHLRAAVDGLDVGLVSVDPAAGQAVVNRAAGALLSLAPGRHSESGFTSALAALIERAVNGAEIAAVHADPHARTECVWRFAEAPTHLRVVATPTALEASDGSRAWIFYDESAVAAGETDRGLLRASFEAQLDPKMVIEAVRDDAGRIVDFVYAEVNRATCQQLGVARERLIGRGLCATLPEFQESGLLHRYAECVDTGSPVVIDDYTYTNTALAQTRQCDIRASRVHADFLTITWRDVTERFDVMRRIAESEENFRLLAESLGESIFRITADGAILWMSKSAEQNFGRAELKLGHLLEEFMPKEELADHLARLRAASRGESLSGRSRAFGPDGELHWIHFFLKPFIGADGNPDGLVLTCRIIDAEVAVEEQVADARRLQAEADDRWRRMIDNAAVGTCIADVSGRFEVVNQAMCEFIGYDETTLKQMTWQELTAPEYLDQDLASVEYLLSGRIDSYRTAKQFIHADGHLIWGDLAVSCLRAPGGNVEAFIAQITDITKEVEARQSLTYRDEQNRVLAKRLQAQTDRLTSELRSAADYVASILPGDLDGAVRVSSRYLPSQALAGDFYDYRWIDDDHLIAYLLDVSGHGIQAALLSVSVHNLLRSGSLSGRVLMEPDQVLTALNEIFAMEKHAGQYLTVWFGVYEASTRTLTYSSGGHPPALLVSHGADASQVRRLATGGMPVGMFSDSGYDCGTVQLSRGDALLVYSDGAYEMPTPDGRSWSLTDFTAVFSQIAATPGWTLDTLIDNLRGRTLSGAFEDDLSMFSLNFVD